jgi:hypothetical protein
MPLRAHYSALSHGEVSPLQSWKQLDLLECGIILIQDNTAPHHHHFAADLAQPSYFPDLLPCEYLGEGTTFGCPACTANVINKADMASLSNLSMYNYNTVIEFLLQ